MKKSRNQIKNKLGTLSEKELRILLCDLFNHLGFSEVIEYHGVNELGKDIVFWDKDKLLKQTWYACVVKAKDINQSSFDEIARQINECFRKKYPSHSAGNVKINQVIVITSGIYKDNAKAQIADLITEKGTENNVQYWDVGDISEKIENSPIIDILFKNNNFIQGVFNNYTLGIITQESSLKILENDFDVNIGKLDDFQIRIRAKSVDFELEREEYLKSIDLTPTKIPVKFLPDIEELLRSKKPFFIHGIATSGKTTILRKLGKDFINKNESGFVFFIELSKYKERLVESDFQEILQDIFKTVTGETLALEKLDKENKLLILLDGLDEISDATFQDIVLNKAINLSLIENIKLIISSRTNDYILASSKIKEKFNTYELLPLSFNEMIELGGKILEQDDKKTSFIKLVKKNEIINSFPKTPLTTILLAVLFKENKINAKELPRNITELYSKFTDVFLNKWDKNKGISQQFKYQEKQFVIQKLANHLHKNNMTSISEQGLIEFLENLLIERPIEGFKNARDFIHNICERTSILVKDTYDNSYRFFHLTIQEYLTSSLLSTEDEDTLVKNYYDNWWLNTNIFYAGKTPHKSNILLRVSKLSDNYPGNEDTKLSYIVHTSKILQASHLLENSSRVIVLKSMIKIFDELLQEVLKDSIYHQDIRLKKRSVLEFILWGRRTFFEFFSSKQFLDSLDSIRKELLEIEAPSITDITEYCLAYCVSLNTQNSRPLYDFLEQRKNLNPRWYKIIDVDVNIKNLSHPDKKLSAKFKSKALKNKEYIQKQFKDVLTKHYNSITGIN